MIFHDRGNPGTDYSSIGDGTRSGWSTLQDSVLSSPTLTATLLELPSEEEPESGLTASTPVSEDSAPAHINGVWPFCGLRVWRR